MMWGLGIMAQTDSVIISLSTYLYLKIGLFRS